VRMKKFQESLADRDKAVDLDPKSPEVYIARGGTYHLLGQHEKGFADRTTAIRLDPGSAVAWTARGDAYFLLGRWDEALADLEQASRLDPSNQETAQLKQLAKSHVDEKIGEAKAKEAMPETARLSLPKPQTEPEPATPVATPAAAPATTPPAPASSAPSAGDLHAKGRQLIQEEKFAAAIVPLTEAVKLDPSLSTAFNARGYCYSRIKKYKEAIADFDQAIKLNPGYANAYTNRSAARRAAGDKVGADSDQAKARDLLRTK
jgi:tetratricopeptide (TPR) repeat protein